MPPRVLECAPIALCALIILAATVPDARSAGADPQGGSTEVTAEQLVSSYQAALLRKITLQIAPGPNGVQPTVESAVWQICQQVSVPYQIERSRTAAAAQVAASAAPMTRNAVAAADAIRAVCASAGLEPQLDADGVYLVPVTQPAVGQAPSGPADAAQAHTAPSRPLSNLQRAQIGAALNVTARTLLKKDTDKDRTVIGDLHDDGEELKITTKRTRQQIQLEISMVSTRSLGDVRAKVTFYGYRHTLIPEDSRSRHAPSYDEKRTPIVLQEQELPVGDLSPRQQRVGRSRAATAEYTDTSYEAVWLVRVRRGNHTETEERRDTSGPFRSGTRYRDWIVDVYAGDYLIKVVTSNRGLFYEFGRDRTTGFPR
jgi:hypothetical protein